MVEKSSEHDLTEDQKIEKQIFLNKDPLGDYTGHILVTNPQTKNDLVFGSPKTVLIKRYNDAEPNRELATAIYDKNFKNTNFYSFLIKSNAIDNNLSNNEIDEISKNTQKLAALICKVTNTNINNPGGPFSVLTKDENDVLEKFTDLTNSSQRYAFTKSVNITDKNTKYGLQFLNNNDKNSNFKNNSLITNFLQLNKTFSSDKQKVSKLLEEMKKLPESLETYDELIKNNLSDNTLNDNFVIQTESNTTKFFPNNKNHDAKIKQMMSVLKTSPPVKNYPSGNELLIHQTPFFVLKNNKIMYNDESQIKEGLNTYPVKNQYNPLYYPLHKLNTFSENSIEGYNVKSIYKDYMRLKDSMDTKTLTTMLMRQYASSVEIFKRLRQIYNNQEEYKKYRDKYIDRHVDHLKTEEGKNGNTILVDMFLKSEHIVNPLDLINSIYVELVDGPRIKNPNGKDFTILGEEKKFNTNKFKVLFPGAPNRDANVLAEVVFNYNRNSDNNNNINMKPNHPELNEKINEAAKSIIKSFNILTKNIEIDSKEKEPEIAKLINFDGKISDDQQSQRAILEENIKQYRILMSTFPSVPVKPSSDVITVVKKSKTNKNLPVLSPEAKAMFENIEEKLDPNKQPQTSKTEKVQETVPKKVPKTGPGKVQTVVYSLGASNNDNKPFYDLGNLNYTTETDADTDTEFMGRPPKRFASPEYKIAGVTKSIYDDISPVLTNPLYNSGTIPGTTSGINFNQGPEVESTVDGPQSTSFKSKTKINLNSSNINNKLAQLIESKYKSKNNKNTIKINKNKYQVNKTKKYIKKYKIDKFDAMTPEQKTELLNKFSKSIDILNMYSALKINKQLPPEYANYNKLNFLDMPEDKRNTILEELEKRYLAYKNLSSLALGLNNYINI